MTKPNEEAGRSVEGTTGSQTGPLTLGYMSLFKRFYEMALPKRKPIPKTVEKDTKAGGSDDKPERGDGKDKSRRNRSADEEEKATKKKRREREVSRGVNKETKKEPEQTKKKGHI